MVFLFYLFFFSKSDSAHFGYLLIPNKQ